MQAIMETLFDAVYLITVITLGIIMITKSKERKEYKLFGIMAVILGCGDAFHLIPRAYSLCTDGLAAHTAALGVGKLITSITMTIFYLILFEIWKMRYHKADTKSLNFAMYGLALIRIILCLLPQNKWASADALQIASQNGHLCHIRRPPWNLNGGQPRTH